MRKCKCGICGKELTTDIAYAVKDNKRNHYYCSEFEYKEYNRKKAEEAQNKQRLYDVFIYVIGYKTTNPALFKFIGQWTDIKNSAEAIDDHKAELMDILCRKTFKSEYGMFSYLAAVVNNHLQDWIKEYQSKIEEERNKDKCSDADLYMPKRKKPKHRICFDDFLD